MIPITWPELANLHPFAPLGQAQGYQQMFRVRGGGSGKLYALRSSLVLITGGRRAVLRAAKPAPCSSCT